MTDVFIALLAAHLIGDFPLQSDRIAQNKHKLSHLTLHTGVIIALSILLLGNIHAIILAVIAVTHAAADYLKATRLPDNFITFIVDQAIHILVIATLAYVYPATYEQGIWPTTPIEPFYIDGLIAIAGFIICVFTGAYVIKFFTAPFRDELPEEQFDGLAKGGFYIGCLERALVFVFVVAGQTLSVGFLITAKSLLRFGEIKDAAQRKIAEYIIIGTFASFGWSLLVSSITLKLIQQ